MLPSLKRALSRLPRSIIFHRIRIRTSSAWLEHAHHEMKLPATRQGGRPVSLQMRCFPDHGTISRQFMRERIQPSRRIHCCYSPHTVRGIVGMLIMHLLLVALSAFTGWLRPPTFPYRVLNRSQVSGVASGAQPALVDHGMTGNDALGSPI
jgi:hypothetical protein